MAGGTAPLAAFDNSYVPVAIYIMLTAAISLVAMSRVTDKYKATLD